MPPRIRGRLHEAARRLIAAGASDDIDEGKLEAELMYAEAAGWDRTRVLAEGAEVPEHATLAAFEKLLERREAREPLAYILGRREFYGLTFEVGPGVLIPRPETETLVEATLAAIREHPNHRRVVRAVDVGTGCGAIALAVAKHAINVEMFAIDTSTEALAYAGRNRESLGLMERVVLLAGPLLEPLPKRVEIIATNLPYIPTDVWAELPPELHDAEPRLAFDGGTDGLDLLRGLLEELPDHVADGPAAVLIEVGAGQAEDVAALFAPFGDSAVIHDDLAGIGRVVEVRRGF
ncbi:MAG TPA: peptide chain release factor N(5)-glutamine methyltransferase [Dehalococcoidia bacterium]|nr:peptide chain release factor N(5)-glutamine methyltransferase [Dehalococcoidia bacterium]